MSLDDNYPPAPDADVFKRLATARPIPTARPRPSVGVHRMTVIGVRQLADRDGNPIVVADLMTVDEPRTEHEWAWFLGAPGFSGRYQLEACQSFFQAACTSAGLTLEMLAEDSADTLAMLVGVELVVAVVEIATKARSGRTVTQATWDPVAGADTSVEVLERVAIAAEKRALDLAGTNPERSAAWMEVFGRVVGRI